MTSNSQTWPREGASERTMHAVGRAGVGVGRTDRRTLRAVVREQSRERERRDPGRRWPGLASLRKGSRSVGAGRGGVRTVLRLLRSGLGGCRGRAGSADHRAHLLHRYAGERGQVVGVATQLVQL